MPRPIQARISHAALAHNLSVARRHAGGAFVWAVIKANAYGHGIERGVASFAAADGLAMLDLNEAVRCREAGWVKSILLLEGIFEARDLEIVERYGLLMTVHCAQQIDLLQTHALQRPVDVYLKMNSGMNRLGFKPAAYRNAWERLRALRHVGTITLMTHFADADVAGGTDAARTLFAQTTEGLPGPRALANSAAVLGVPEAIGDAVRPGIMLYGSSPFADRTAASLDLQPGMTLVSEIIGTQDLLARDAVGYGSTFRAEKPMRIGIVACGYADGYPRHCATGTPIAVAGARTRTIGRVSMDMLAVDLTDLPQAGIGSSVELWGAQIPIDEVARAAGTIGYELMCAVAPRVPMLSVD
ncbi:alanine racemase [beta proteobacterium AAP99]|nr:alanine racemase [beta proteobacterium AAP99]